MNGPPDERLLEELRHSLDRVCRHMEPADTAAAVLRRIHGRTPSELLDQRRARGLRNLSAITAVLLAGMWATILYLDHEGAGAAPTLNLDSLPPVVAYEPDEELPQYSRETNLIAGVFLGEVVR